MSFVPAIARITEDDMIDVSAHLQITDESKKHDEDMLRSLIIADRFIKARKAKKDLAMTMQSIEMREEFEALVDAQALMPLPVAPEEIQRLPYHLTHGIPNFDAHSAIYGELPGIFDQTKPMVIKRKARSAPKKARKVRRQFSKIPKAQRLIKKAQAVVPAARRPVEVKTNVEVKAETDVEVKTSSGRTIKRPVVHDV